MCGIHLHLSRLVQVHDDDKVEGKDDCRGKTGFGGEEEEKVKKKEYALYPAWLCRRGPDHQG
jgi:hypothetical protein